MDTHRFLHVTFLLILYYIIFILLRAILGSFEIVRLPGFAVLSGSVIIKGEVPHLHICGGPQSRLRT